MKFDTNLGKKEYIEFFNKFGNANVLQSFEWGSFSEVAKNQKAVYVGLKDNKDNLVAASLLLKKVTPLHMCYYYAPRGFLIDYKDKELLNCWTDNLKAFLKQENAIYLKVDPPIYYQELDNNANIVENGFNNYEIFNNLISLGYRHQGFNKNYEKNQPRYTFKIDFKGSIEDIQGKMSSSFKKALKKSQYYEPQMEIGTEKDIDIFYKLYQHTADRDGFNTYDLSYYQNFYKTFSDQNKATIFKVNINPKSLIKKIDKDIIEYENNKKNTSNKNKIIEIDNSVNKLNNDKALLSEYKELDKLTVACHIMLYNQKECVAFFAASDKRFRFTFANNYLYLEKFKYVKENHPEIELLDLFGVTGDPNSKVKNLKGLYEFKKSLGADLYEYIGEFDIVIKPFWYRVLPILLKVYRKIRKSK